MSNFKKWGLIAGIFVGSFIALTIIAILLEKYAGLDLGPSIIGIYIAIPIIWFVFIFIKTIFKGSSFLMRRYYLFLAKFYFKKKYPQVNYSEFSTMRLLKMCNVKVRFPNLDIPLLDDEELDRLNTETNVMNAKSVAKASWWVTKNTAKATWWATKTTAKATLKTAEMAGTAMNAAGSALDSSSSSATKSSLSNTWNAGDVEKHGDNIKALKDELKRYEERYKSEASLPYGSRGLALEVIEDRIKDIKHKLEHEESWRDHKMGKHNQ
jgi:hypothetical protein